MTNPHPATSKKSLQVELQKDWKTNFNNWWYIRDRHYLQAENYVEQLLTQQAREILERVEEIACSNQDYDDEVGRYIDEAGFLKDLATLCSTYGVDRK